MRASILLWPFLALASFASDSPSFLTELAEMVEVVMLETGFSININGSEEDSVNINIINGRSVIDHCMNIHISIQNGQPD